MSTTYPTMGLAEGKHVNGSPRTARVVMLGLTCLADLALSILLTSCGGSTAAGGPGNQTHTYTTNFSGTENPISENGKWINGRIVGLDWANVLSATGKAEGVGPASAPFSDPTAILTGTWGPDQSVTETVFSNGVEDKPTTGFDKEVEIRLRTSISAHRITGYEINCRTPNDSTSYLQIVRWNGALGDFTPLAAVMGTGCGNGDVLKATITGDTIHVYRNGTLMLTITDGTFTTGSPGIGFNFGCGSNYPDFGITSYTVSD